MIALWCGVVHLLSQRPPRSGVSENMQLLYNFVLPKMMLRNLPALQEQGVFAYPSFLVNGIYVGGLFVLRMIL